MAHIDARPAAQLVSQSSQTVRRPSLMLFYIHNYIISTGITGVVVCYITRFLARSAPKIRPEYQTGTTWHACASWCTNRWNICWSLCPPPRWNTKYLTIVSLVIIPNVILGIRQQWRIGVIGQRGGQRHQHGHHGQTAEHSKPGSTPAPQRIDDQRRKNEQLCVGGQIPRLEHALQGCCVRKCWGKQVMP